MKQNVIICFRDAECENSLGRTMKFLIWLALKRENYGHLNPISFLLEEEEGQRACCLCDPLALWKRVQWKIVPSVNPWQANYSSDPLGVCITIGGREPTNSLAQHG